MPARPILRRVPDAAKASDLNVSLSNLANLVANGITWQNMAALAVSVDFTMPAAVVSAALGGLWLAQTPVGFYKDAGRVWLSGRATGGSPSTTTPLFTLPQAYWPTSAVYLTAAQSSIYEGGGEIVIDAQGNVTAPIITSVQSGVAAYLSLDGLSFPASDPTPVLPGLPFPLSLPLKVPGGAPVSVWPLSCQDRTNRQPAGAATPAIVWENGVVGGAPVFRILNAVGCFPGRTYRLRFVVASF